MSDVVVPITTDDAVHYVFGAFSAVLGVIVWLLNRSIARIDKDIESKASVESVENIGKQIEDLKSSSQEQHRQTHAQLSMMMNRLMDGNPR
jgi:hypothetical protein